MNLHIQCRYVLWLLILTTAKGFDMIKLTTAANVHQYTVYFTSTQDRSVKMVDNLFTAAELPLTKAEAETLLQAMYSDPTIEVQDII